jgi:hypothetical protein
MVDLQRWQHRRHPSQIRPQVQLPLRAEPEFHKMRTPLRERAKKWVDPHELLGHEGLS